MLTDERWGDNERKKQEDNEEPKQGWLEKQKRRRNETKEKHK